MAMIFFTAVFAALVILAALAALLAATIGVTMYFIWCIKELGRL
jgi:hypothetical protein